MTGDAAPTALVAVIDAGSVIAGGATTVAGSVGAVGTTGATGKLVPGSSACLLTRSDCKGALSIGGTAGTASLAAGAGNSKPGWFGEEAVITSSYYSSLPR